jgi:multiple sugar transport system permease protein
MFVLSIVAAILLPVYHLFTMGFKLEKDTFSIPPKWLFFPTIEHYLKLFEVAPFALFLLNSTVISLGSVVVSLLLGLPAAYALAHLEFRGKTAVLFSILSIRLIPPMCVVLPFFLFYSKVRLVDTYAGLIIIYLTFNLSLVIWMMKTFFEDLPRVLYDAAAIDGASVWQIFYGISLPLVSHGIVATGILCFSASWIEFLYALILTRRYARTAIVGLTIFMRFEDTQWGAIAAGGTIVTLPVIIFAFALRRFLVRGLTQGAVKE